MSSKQYIQVKTLALPDPATYCPSGFVLRYNYHLVVMELWFDQYETLLTDLHLYTMLIIYIVGFDLKK